MGILKGVLKSGARAIFCRWVLEKGFRRLKGKTDQGGHGFVLQ
jgi:hypothetical protein